MAYSDIDRSSFEPKGLALAALLNGGLLAAALLAGSTVANIIKDKPLKSILIDVSKEKPPPPPPVQREKKLEKKLVIPRTDTNQKSARSGNMLGEDQTRPAIDDSGTDIVIPTPPILPPAPFIEPHQAVIKIARLDPRFGASLQPEYPPSELRAGTEGSVAIRVLVGIDGRVKDVQILSAASDGLAEATKKQALKKWRFIAATSDGDPIESWREMTVRFEIPE